MFMNDHRHHNPMSMIVALLDLCTWLFPVEDDLSHTEPILIEMSASYINRTRDVIRTEGGPCTNQSMIQELET